MSQPFLSSQDLLDAVFADAPLSPTKEAPMLPPSVYALSEQPASFSIHDEEQAAATWQALIAKGKARAETLPSLDEFWSSPEALALQTDEAQGAKPHPETLPLRAKTWWSRLRESLMVGVSWRRPAWGLVFACCGVLLLGTVGKGWWEPSLPSKNPEGLRAKGRAAKALSQAPWKAGFSFFYKRDGVVKTGRDELLVREGDQLRFSYQFQSNQHAFLWLFMVDSRGKISPLYPASPTLQAFPLLPTPKGVFKDLPDGALLDDAKEPERLFVCLSWSPLPFARLEHTLKKGLEKHPLSKLQHVDLPCFFQKSWLLRKGEH